MTTDRNGSEHGLEQEIAGLRHGLICTVALLVGLLEERGLLENGLYRSALAQALAHLTDEERTPEGQVLVDFVQILDDGERHDPRIN